MGIWGWGGRYGASGTGTPWRLGQGLAEGCGSVAGGETFFFSFLLSQDVSPPPIWDRTVTEGDAGGTGFCELAWAHTPR